ncbi:restriction endonuclease subunit S [Vibrio coralliilyticus]|uniref:restriction endonuclease subunit S n=1 Tax=Vibrio coralliilyticus TaxID=190893 RepID=UPI001E4850FB|nr:restriction endonuclease subunit S [Vibrio coralliilyticus]MCC2524995.1 restriction endonuclease subunit S [Vibrio coralliilyticus]
MNWSNVALSTLVDIKGGGTPSKANPEYWNGSIPWASVKDFKSSDLNGASDYITQEGIDNSATSLIPSGNLIVPTRMALGKVAINSVDIAINQDLKALIIKDESVVDTEYLFRCIQSKSEEIVRQGKGATVKGITVDVLKNLQIPLPPLETQKQIAAVLEKADQLRKDCQQMELELNSLAQSVFIDMFGDPLTNPKGWEVRKLKEFYISEKDGTKCGPFGSALKKEEFVESGVPVWNMDNITLNGTFRDGASLWITKQKYEELDKYSVNQGDVIISRAGTVGKMGVVKSIYEQSIISTNLIRVRFGDKLDPLYFVCLMTYFKTRLKRLKVGDDGSFSHMNTGILDQLEFPYPPVEEQQKYIKFRSKLDDEIERLTSLKNEYECNFNSLMQKAFKGELNL